MNFKYGDFITNRGYHPMGEALIQLSGLNGDIYQMIVDHVREEYVPNPEIIKDRVIQLMGFMPQRLKNRFWDMMFAYSDCAREDDIPEFIMFFLSYAPLVMTLDVIHSEGMVHPKAFFQVLDRAELKRCHEDVALFVMRSCFDKVLIPMKDNPERMQPGIDHCQTGLKRNCLFDGDHSRPSGTYDHPDLLAAYNHLYLFR